MKLIFYTLLLGSALATALAACTDEENASSASGGVAATISAGITSRAVDNKWNEKDEIGITMLSKVGNKVIDPYTNYCYATDGSGDFDPNPTDKRIYFPQDGSEVTFKSYYPYSGNHKDMTALPVNVTSQDNLPAIDLMTAEHISGSSKADAHVKLHFYHRLAKIIVNLSTDGEDIIPLDGCKLVIKGLKTTGSYDLMSETLTVNEGSGADMAIGIKNKSGHGIILPRVAGEGVIFEITTADGGVYTAIMDKELEIKGGYKHTFHIVLRKTPIEVSATIEDWLEGPETQLDVVRVVTGLGENQNVAEGSILHLFLKDQGGYAHAADYTYTSDAWTTDTPIYWESIQADPAGFRGTLTYVEKLNDTQMDDLMVSDDAEVEQYTGTHLTMKHVGAKATVELKSTNGTFSADDLKNATITFPGYKTSGTINDKGEFVIGTTTGDVLAADGVAIFPPQTIKKGDVVARITINGRDYEIKAETDGGFDFAQGKNTKLILDMSKAEIKVSTEILAWGDGGTHNYNEVKIGPANLSDNGGDVKDGDKLYLYTGTDEEARTQLNGYFTYQAAGTQWNYSETTPLYWEHIASTGNIYASITRPAISTTDGNNQLPDYITATPIENKGGTDNTVLNFTLGHAVAKVRVILTSKTYALDKLNAATVILPGYAIGGTVDKGIFKAGTSTGNITIDGFSGESTTGGLASTESTAYLQAQEIAANATVVKITIDGRVYEAKQNSKVTYTAGKVTTLTVNIEKSAVNLSANVTGWADGDSATFEGLFFTTSGSASGFKDNDVIRIFKTANNGVSGTSNDTYTYSGNETSGTFESTAPWYRDDFQTGNGISAVYPATNTNVADGQTSFSWTCSGNNIAHDQDVMVAAGSIGDQANISLTFNHVLSKVTVNIFAGDGFTNNELGNCDVALNNFKLAGNVNVITGTASATEDATGSFAPSKLSEAYTVDSKGKAAASHESFIMPQTIETGTKVVTVTLNGVTYEAKLSNEMKFEAGKRGVLNITLKKTGISLQASVAAWGTGPTGDITIK